MSAGQYIKLVKRKELRDPVLSFQLSNDFHVLKLIPQYERRDEASGPFAPLVEWINIHYQGKAPLLRTRSSRVRVGAAQWIGSKPPGPPPRPVSVELEG